MGFDFSMKSKKKHSFIKLTCFLAVFIGLSALSTSSESFAAIYYVDSLDGNDSNSGTSPQSAWSRISRVNSEDFSPGDQILFRSGGVWREQLVIKSSGTSSNPIVIGSYNQGNLPLITGSISKSIESDWRAEGRLWHTFVPEQPQTVWRNRERLTRVSSKNLLNNSSQWWWDAGYRRVYVFSTLNPTDGGTFFDIPQRSSCITGTDISHIVIDGLSLKYSNDSIISINRSLGSSQGWTIRNCDIAAATRNGIVTQGGSASGQFDHVTITDNTISDIGGTPGFITAGIRIQFGDRYNISRNKIELTDFPGVSGQQRGISVENGRTDVDTGNRISENKISGVSSQRVSCAIGVWNSGFISIHDNIITSDALAGIWLDETRSGRGDGPTRCSIFNNLVESTGSNTEFGIFLKNSPSNRIFYNVINAASANRYNKGIWVRSMNGGDSNSTEIYNNTIVVPASSNCLQIGWSSDSVPTSNSTVRNNIFLKTGGNSAAVVIDSNNRSLQANHLFNNNLYDTSSSPIMNWFGIIYRGIDEFRTTEQEIAGKQGDPMFVNALAGNFRLLTSSPAINSGAPVGLTRDFEGSPISGLPDIGAFENATLTGTMTGIVRDASGNSAISGANIVLTPGNYNTQTDASGRYTFASIPAGTYSLTATLQGYNNRTLSGNSITAGGTRTLDFTMTRVTNTISGRITNSSNSSAISGVNVVVTPGNYSHTTDANGNYSISGIPDGTYTVTATRSGFNTNSTSGITVSQGSTRTVNLALQPSSSSSGTIYWRSTFETGNVSEWTAGNRGKHEGGGYITTERPRRGRYSWKAYNDPSLSGIMRISAKLLRWSFDYDQAYYSAWFFWPTDYTVTGVPNQYVNIFQWKERVNPWNPTWIVAVTNGSTGQDEITVHDWYGKRLHKNRVILPKGRWFHLEAFMRVGRGNGQLTVWLDGVQIYNFNNINISGGSYNRYLMWGVGNYGQSGLRKHLYVDDCAVSSYRLGPHASFKTAGEEGADTIEESNLPDEFAIKQNYPNPFNPSTTIEFALPESSKVDIKVFNIMGQEIKTLVNKHKGPGRYSVIWDGTDNSSLPVTSGIYFYHIKAGNFRETHKMMLLK